MGVWDTQRTLVPNHSHSSSLLNNKSPNTVRSPTSQTKQITTTTAPVTPKKNLTASELLDLNIHNPTKEKSGYLGSEKWLPALRKVKRPRSIYNAASLAYIGDCIYELYAHRHFLFPPLNIEDYDDHVKAIVCCEAQDVLLKNLLKGDYLTERKEIVVTL
ncbi:PREDICTED: uncharacterized protein LOC104600727 isoform X2 [Nelumbo nucifera]|uniref:Uncharacterized protein LOC104600727 isoform X2 n=1 Tax=Nelumbo nucifera TaxID=4432 RepID=A0A1U8A6K6_NELNU|nr:PREDICTED: uncharacterized protein LOC104600727 isoform X2 [Nelumbo nucifera]XP_010262142.1 PREDICTED: uncharacterized protein LOC104600727 isoform X2 [Nelumbo nucifera]